MKQEALDREERVAWRDAQKIQADVQAAQTKIQTEEKRRAEEIQMAKIEADIELTLKEMKWHAQAEVNTDATSNLLRLIAILNP